MAETQLFVDRLEDTWAILIPDIPDMENAEEELLPLSALPANVEEGDWLKVDIPDHYTVRSFFEAIRDGEKIMPEFIHDRAIKDDVKKQVEKLMNELSS